MTLPFPLSSAGGAASHLYTAAAGLRAWLYRKHWMPQNRLRSKVVSIGNIAWGGTGKTPFTIWLASRLAARGLQVSILTRGYRRTSSEPVRILPPGTSPAAARGDGDEVQLYLRHLSNVPVGVASWRYAAGRDIEDRFPVDVHLLDDGFQHLSLARDVDIVLVDARNPWGARAGLARLLRESPRALRRADAILITSAGLPMNGKPGQLDSLQEALSRVNPDVPQFTASTRLLHFASGAGTTVCPVEEMKSRRAVAFCGLGSPDNFFAMLSRSDISPMRCKVFPDHYRYTAADLKQLGKLARDAGADCLITTEKDQVNLPPAATLTVPLYWAEIEMALDEEECLMAWIGEKLGLPAGKATAGAWVPEAFPDRRATTVNGAAKH